MLLLLEFFDEAQLYGLNVKICEQYRHELAERLRKESGLVIVDGGSENDD